MHMYNIYACVLFLSLTSDEASLKHGRLMSLPLGDRGAGDKRTTLFSLFRLMGVDVVKLEACKKKKKKKERKRKNFKGLEH